MSQVYLKRAVKLIKILWCKWHYGAASKNVFAPYPIEPFWSADFLQMVRPNQFVFAVQCACTCIRISIRDVRANWYGPA